MTALSREIRAAVVDRAGCSCEYCLLPTSGQVASFHLDHVVPRIAGGSSDLANLALACPHCNAHKWAQTEGKDPVTGQLTPLFNPRVQIWAEHFEWLQAPSGQILGKTPAGRATIVALKMNADDMLAVRALLAELGRFPPSAR